MKSLVHGMCLLAVSASQIAWADASFNAYRLGNYYKAAEPLLPKSGKDPIADYYLGKLYLYGYGELKNNDLAMQYFTKSAEKGYLPAIQLMARYSLMQEKNLEAALQWFKKAATAGDVDAQMYMAAAYLFGLGVKKNADIASHYYIDAAKNGDATAQFVLAENFIDSRNAGNKKLGLIWLNKSAKNGNVRALTKLGLLYNTGTLVTKDVQKGLDLLIKAVEKNYTPAMLALGDLALAQHEANQAKAWFQKAIDLHDINAYLHLAHVYLQANSVLYNSESGFLYTLKAAQEDSIEAKKELANLYQKGIGVKVNAALAQQWLSSAQHQEQEKEQLPLLAQAAFWLSNNTSHNLEQTNYKMQGIFSPWNNAAVLKNNKYNQAPRLQVITSQEIFKPQFVMTDPNKIPISIYYDALISKYFELQANQWTYPIYPLNPQVEELARVNSFVLTHNNVPIPYTDASYSVEDTNNNLLDLWTPNWQAQVNYKAMFDQMYFKAILGDSQSQFEIGQMFQYGLGVAKNLESAIVFYQNAAEQQHLEAEYNLGLLYLQNAKDEHDYQSAINWLTDGAFKGNRQSQYVLARLLREGKTKADGTLYFKTNPQQAMSMLYLSAANSYGPAEYELAEHLARELNQHTNSNVRAQKIALIRELYQGAVDNGVAQALVPLAFYNAMDSNKEKQAQAFMLAKERAQTGDEKAALLLGMLYDRGIGINADLEKALFWYQKAKKSAVSQFILGTYTVKGRGISQDKEQGKELLQQSADAQFPYAYFNLAVLKQKSEQDFLPALMTAFKLGNSQAGIVLADYYLSENSAANPEKMRQAKAIYTALAQKEDSYAQLKLGFMLANGLGGLPDLTAAQHWYTASAQQGNPEAQYLLGQFYQVGLNTSPDYTQAKEWYQKAAAKLSKASVALGFIYETVEDNYNLALNAYEEASAKGDVIGDFNLALMYEYGKGVAVDHQKAKSLLVAAANKGVDEAMNQLAQMYFLGLGQEKSPEHALSWYKKAAAMGNRNALYSLGVLAETGAAAVKRDYLESFKYYQAAADLNNEEAMLGLARMYYHGLGVTQNKEKAMHIYQKLADRQNADAQYQLGAFYTQGVSGEGFLDKGKQLLKQASDNGNIQARKLLQKLAVVPG